MPHSPNEHPTGARARPRHKTLLPEDWEPSEQTKAWVREEYPEYATRRVLNAFRDHHLAKGNRFLDWERAYRGWIRRQPDFERAAPASNGNTRREPTRTYLGEP